MDLLLSKECESKIRTLCALLPDNEWSGAAFYKYSVENGNVKIYVLDFCLQDIGSSVYTEYELGGDTAAYYAEHIDTLLGCKVGTLHSHNKMSAFFSGTDTSTLKEAGSQMNNILSVIVNNAGQYVAKFTELHKIHKDNDITINSKISDDWIFMGDKPDFRTDEDTEHKKGTEDYHEVKCWDCNIIKPDNVEINEEYEIECQQKIEEWKNKERKKKAKKTWSNEALQLTHFDYKDYNDEGQYTVDNMVHSIINLSFSNLYANYHVPALIKIDNYEFIESFMSAWYMFFLPSHKQLQEVIDRLPEVLSDLCLVSTTLSTSYVIDLLEDLYNNSKEV